MTTAGSPHGLGAEMPSPGIHERWIVFVRADDRSGVLSALAEMFATRGVSFTSFATLAVDDGVGTMSIVFRGSERLARVLVRTLDRLAFTRGVSLVRASDPGVRAVAVVTGADPSPVPAGSALVTVWEQGRSQIVAGSLVEVEAVIAQLRPAGAVVESISVLPPV